MGISGSHLEHIGGVWFQVGHRVSCRLTGGVGGRNRVRGNNPALKKVTVVKDSIKASFYRIHSLSNLKRAVVKDLDS